MLTKQDVSSLNFINFNPEIRMLKKIYSTLFISFCCALLFSLSFATQAEAGPEEFNGKWFMDFDMLVKNNPELAELDKQPDIKAVLETQIKSSFVVVDTAKNIIEFTTPGDKPEIDHFEIVEHSKGKMKIKTSSDQAILELSLQGPKKLKMTSSSEEEALYFTK